jgi:hypothetical protein
VFIMANYGAERMTGRVPTGVERSRLLMQSNPPPLEGGGLKTLSPGGRGQGEGDNTL